MTSVDPSALRDAFGSFMTGVTVVTARDLSGALCGFTANSFTSVSLDPPLLLVCPGKFLSSYQTFATAKHFAVNVLAEGQENISNTFASFKGDRFAEIAYRLNEYGVPLIEDALVQFSCETHQIVDAGDHCLLIGRVTEFTRRAGRGLGYVQGRYFSLGLERGVHEIDNKHVICGAIVETAGHVWLEQTRDGFRPPQISSTSRASLRQALTDDLAVRGLSVRLGAAYSVFDSARTHTAYILAKASAPIKTDLIAIPLNDLAGLSYATEPIADMMQRFASEARSRDFSLYLGDAAHGETHGSVEGI